MIFLDSEGEPIQEFSALYVSEKTGEICDVFHYLVQYPSHFGHDGDRFSRRHVHGLGIDYLHRHGLKDEEELLSLLKQWLKKYPSASLFAHAPSKEINFLNMPIEDVSLLPWKERTVLPSHQTALSFKKMNIPICDTVCNAHVSFHGWRPKRSYCLSPTDIAKCNFSHHCSLYDAFECFLFFFDTCRQ